MEAPTLSELEGLRYSELQKLAKTAGLKANLKADKLLKALKVHFYPESKDESPDYDGGSSLTDTDELNSSQEKDEPVSVSFVTHRRGRGRKPLKNYDTPKDEFLTVSVGTGTESLASETDNTQDQNCLESKKKKVSPPTIDNKHRKRSRSEDTSKQNNSETTEKRQKKASDITSVPSAGKIPRYAGRLSKPESKPSTPNFKKLHEAHFKKMESIDKYMERKQKRLDTVSSSIQEMKMLTKKSNLLKLVEKTPVSDIKKPVKSRLSLLSSLPPTTGASPSRTPTNQRRSGRFSAANKSILFDRSGFKPSVLSSSKMNVRFSEATKDNEHKRSLIKTPARKSSSFLAITPESEPRQMLPNVKKTPARKSLSVLAVTPESEPKQMLPSVKKNEPMATPEKAKKTDLNTTIQPSTVILESTCPQNKEIAITPFKFTAQTTETPNTNKKGRFDLQASLSRPLGYQPHKGKLKPWGGSEENKCGSNNNVSVLKNNFKQPHLQTREDRRKQHEQDRKGKRDQTLGTRRGVPVQ
ncbi:nucleolar and spindle-associated protein 1-A [Xenopus laevis]|uniref:Nucleolar and spindle-associated protein 1-A n=2 Tax=Xenopus laevis TaxID=8355 RepID=NSAPA_XENLA|nr:nucleolar and spindle-associated protein 1-A [Xenopus laevis]Q1W1G1.1 RecName: Full=Nucleolar and spindle-associated protein 1-A; Short=NuSAP A [Xenopus laevis]ABE01880.1 nucleolar and spindle associated protein [Xenopus laevis]